MSEDIKRALRHTFVATSLPNKDEQYFDVRKCWIAIYKEGTKKNKIGLFKIRAGDVYVSYDEKLIGIGSQTPPKTKDKIKNGILQVNCQIITKLDNSFSITRMLMRNMGWIGDYSQDVATEEEIKTVLAYAAIELCPPEISKGINLKELEPFYQRSWPTSQKNR